MYSSRPGLLLGFHGCEQSVRDSIVSGRAILKPSVNRYDWLGVGCYFWENNYERALEFALAPPGKKKYKKPSVLGAVIDLQYCLDLLDATNLSIIRFSYNNFITSGNANSEEIPQNKTIKGSKDRLLRELDWAVIENLHEMHRSIDLRPFDSVRSLFVEGEELYPGAGFHEKNHIQICIRNPNCIKSFFIPRDETPWKG